MNQFTRRHLLAGAAAIAASPLVTRFPRSPRPRPQANRRRFLSLHGRQRRDHRRDRWGEPATGNRRVCHQRQEGRSESRTRRRAHEPRCFVGPYNPIVINTGSKLAVVDTGTGQSAYTASKGTSGQS